MTKRYSLCEQVISGDIFDKYPIGICDKHVSKVLRYPELIDILNEQDERITELEESLGFCRDLLNGTCNSTRMKELYKIIEEMVTDD